jgi:hypothetical protein
MVRALRTVNNVELVLPGICLEGLRKIIESLVIIADIWVEILN